MSNLDTLPPNALNLLPCPFCGSGDIEESTGQHVDGTPFKYIECCSCEAMADPAWWNRRSAPNSNTPHAEWIGVDLDSTLAHYDGWKGPTHIGAPIPLMVERVKAWLTEGITVKVFTARVGPVDLSKVGADYPAIALKAIEDWCLEHIGVVLPVTHMKDFSMWQLWDDRAVQVEPNTGVQFVHPNPPPSTP